MSLLNYLEPWNVPFSYGRVNVHDEAFLSRKMHKLASFVKGHLPWKTSLESTLDSLRTANTDWEEKPKLRNTETSFRPRCTSENCLPEWGNLTEYKGLWNLPTPLKSTAWLNSYSWSCCQHLSWPCLSWYQHTFVSVWSGSQLRCPILSSDFICRCHVHLFFGPWTLWSPPSPFQEAEPCYIISPLFKAVSPVVSHGKPGIALEFQEFPCHSSLFVAFYWHFFILLITVQETVLFNQVKLKKLIILCIFHTLVSTFKMFPFFSRASEKQFIHFFLIFFLSCSRTC